MLTAESWTVDSIRVRLEEQARQVRDYSVIVKVSVSMPKFRMPRKKIKVYYRAGSNGAQDQIKLETRGFAVVPKTGLNFNVDDLLDNFETFQTPVEVQTDEGPRLVVSGTINPDSLRFKSWDSEEETPSLTQSLWVDPARWVVTRTEVRLDTSLVLTVTSEYERYSDQLYLPRKTEVSFALGSQMLQRLDRNRGGPGPLMQEAEPEFEAKDFSGHVVMEFTRYRVNKGIPDEVFAPQEPQ